MSGRLLQLQCGLADLRTSTTYFLRQHEEMLQLATEEYDLKFYKIFSLEHKLREEIQLTMDKGRNLPSIKATIGDYREAIASPAHQERVKVLATFGRLVRDLERLKDNKTLLMQDHEYNDAVSHLKYIRDMIDRMVQ